MCRSATSSERRARAARIRRALASLALSAFGATVPGAFGATVMHRSSATARPVHASAGADAATGSASSIGLTVDEALELAFPKCRIERVTEYLSEAQAARAAVLAGETLPSAVVHRYIARSEGQLVGTAYFDTHKVRTLGETLLVVVDRDERVARIELIAFAEPREYAGPGAFYGQFRGQALNPKLSLKGDIRGVTGASLTASATTRAVRRTLAVHRVLADAPAPRRASAAGS